MSSSAIITDSLYVAQLQSILNAGRVQISRLKPSEWTEQNVVMQKPFPGKFKYSKTPYTREIIDCASPDHPARWVAVMKGAQIGFSAGVIYPAVGWMIKNNPGNTFITVGAPDLIEKAMEKLDLLIDNAGLRNYIRPQVQRNRMNKSGDTNLKKEFPGGYVTIASANNHKALRQVDLQFGFFDDFESVKSQSKESGDTRKLLEQRFAAYADTHKIFYISTPELKSKSNIEPAYLLGDQRKFLVPCPCCGVFIELKWSVQNGDITGGITYKTDDYGKVVSGTVGYVCQMCAGFFTDKSKHELLNNGYWHPTAEPSKAGYYSYHISSLYAPIGMYDWEHYAHNYCEANPINQPRKEGEHKAFVNLCLGETYEPISEQPRADMMSGQERPYYPCSIPEKLSISDGNGKIILITCAADMNGTEDDARLDYEVVAWSERGASYSIMHGSIGTFVKGEGSMKIKQDRAKWTYRFGAPNNVWDEFDKIRNRVFDTDTGRKMTIYRTGLDCGYFSNSYAYPYIDKSNPYPNIYVSGLKGKGQEEYILFDKDLRYFKDAQERNNLFILYVGRIKDELSEHMQLKWDNREMPQEYGFMNFPMPHDGMYGFKNYFEHFQSEERVIEANEGGTGVAACWKKKNSTVANHMWDCRVYNIAIRQIVVEEVRKILKLPKLTWKEFAVIVQRQKG